MRNREPKKKLVGSWRSLQAVIWLAGIYILASHNWWWPGILVLVAISAIYEGLLQRFAPEAFEDKEIAGVPTPAGTTRFGPEQGTVAPAMHEHRIELLPQVCPNCSAPVRSHEVKWTGAQSANCAYCGTNLPMSKA